MKLIIAEKPSVGKAIADVVGATNKDKGFYTGNGYIVSWCVGHLIGTAMPEDYNPDNKRWKLENLPIIPERWQYKVTEDTKSQYYTLKELMHRKDIDSLVCATDAGREGELIFRLVYNQAGCTKPFERLWVSSVEESAIKAGMDALKPSAEYDNLYQAALCRMQADWLVGINETRYYTTAYNTKLSVGRVQTPALNILVNRTAEIQNFEPQKYYIVAAVFDEFSATLRENTLEDMEKTVEDCTKNPHAYVTKVEKETKKSNPPTLFSLSTLQGEANALFGYTLQETLDICQSLYDKKLSTYPRSDSNYLPSSMAESLPTMFTSLCSDKRLTFINEEIISRNTMKTENLVNDAKVSDHHAIIPTQSYLTADTSMLPEAERNILSLIVGRFICAAADPQEYNTTKVWLEVHGEAANHTFTVTGKEVTHAGYKEIEMGLKKYFRYEEEKSLDIETISSDTLLPAINEGEEYNITGVSFKEKETSPPSLYTDKTLLEAMKNVASTITDKDLKAAIKEVGGLGTEATRAGILESLIKTGYVVREGKRKVKNLLPTEKGITLIQEVKPELKDPVTTALWEQKLDEISKGNGSPAAFMVEIENFVREHIEVEKQFHDSEATAGIFAAEKSLYEKASLGKCPRCQSEVYEGKQNFYCSKGKDCGFALWKEDKFFTNKGKKLGVQNVRDLLGKGETIIKGCKSMKTEKTYDIKVTLKDTGKYINYGMEFLPSKAPAKKAPVKSVSK